MVSLKGICFKEVSKLSFPAFLMILLLALLILGLFYLLLYMLLYLFGKKKTTFSHIFKVIIYTIGVIITILFIGLVIKLLTMTKYW